MEIKPGHKTTEFWMTAITNVVLAVFGALVTFGSLSGEQAEALQAIVLAVVPLAIAIATGAYATSRAKVKAAG